MHNLTKRQQQIVNFILHCQQAGGVLPSFQDIADHFGFRSPNAVMGHIKRLRAKGALASEPGRARSLRVLSAFHGLRKRVVDIPVYDELFDLYDRLQAEVQKLAPAAIHLEKPQARPGIGPQTASNAQPRRTA